MLHVHRAERADRLADALAELLAEPLADPFAAEVVSVPERGIERWLGHRLAHRLGTSAGHGDGVCANVVFPAPSAVVAAAVSGATGIDPDADPWHPARAVWPLLEIIDESAGETWCSALGAHLGGAGRGRRYAVARRLADLFASYAAHRPQMLGRWRGGTDTDGVGPLPEDLHWQPELWRRLRARLAAPDPAERVAAATAALRSDPGLADLPARLSLFGPTRLPTAHLAVLDALAQHRDVHLWLPHPSPALWERVRPDTGAATRRREDPTADRPAHPLLSSLGRDVRELQLRLGGAATDRHHELPDPPATLLGALHRDLRDDRAPDGPPRPGHPDRRPLLAPDDRSVQVHSCHGADRQVEVLREVVLGLLAADDTLEPRDVLVMCPDIETFAPLISASFGLGPGADAGSPEADLVHPGHRLQVRLADRALRQVNPLLGTVATLLELADARVTSSQVLDLASSGPVRRRFRFDDDDLDRLSDLVVRAGVRWGLDAEHRRPYRLESFPQNTWSAGLDRMLLGVAMAEDEGAGQAWLGTALPLDDIDSSDVDLVGRFAELLDRLGAVLAGLTGERPLTGWAAALAEGLDALTACAPADAWQAAQARGELADVVRSAGPHADAMPLSLPDARGLLAGRLRGRPSRANFRTGTLTVCTMVPMRSVPHRVVCLLGLDDGVFPRAGADDGDDVLARDPVVGERDPRSEDRQLLLDAIRAATEHLIVLYSGADERTNARRPPAVPLGELLDTIDATVRAADGTPARTRVVVRHPLQPFDPRNFTDGALGGGGPSRGPFSFDRAGLAGAVAGTGERRAPRPFLEYRLPPAPEPATVELEQLARFVEHPVKAFLRQRMGVTLFTEDGDPDDALPVALDALQKWSVGDRLLRDRLAGHDLDRCRQAEWRRGELPPGVLGMRVLDDVLIDVEPLVAAAATVRTGPRSAVDVLAELRDAPAVAGTVSGMYGETIVRVEYSRLGPKHRLRAWVQLLALTASHPGTPWRAVTLGRGGFSPTASSVLGPVDPDLAARVLADLVALHRAGLREPLPMALKTSHSYARKRVGGGSVAQATAAAAKTWAGPAGSDQADAANALVWGAEAPAEVLIEAPGGPTTPDEPTRFGTLAVRLWAPLLAAEKMVES
ncbi:exodeoxyribonuclease V subunit gamma [Pseudonocardia sp. H11422]|uniref:exodeoxyribonuclease V subunit gamma n=1 Tax=Pseudonocardia sp. H11422 TaxID=2835866 RepID=UPI0027E25432|nr:exodeoxyribonuclease V subunit gamma [Pseudonocardia sp. H11422]